MLLSPLDWALIETWQEREVPLHIILSGIERVFDAADKQPNKKRTIKSLLYCKEEIEAQYAEWLERQVGKRTEKQETKAENQKINQSNLFSDETIAAHLERVSLELKAAKNKSAGALKDSLERVFAKLTELRSKSATAEQLEESLEKLDAQIDESLLQTFETETLKPEIEKQIASYKNKMETEVYQRTFDLMLLKKLREQAEIPRLSLFNL